MVYGWVVRGQSQFYKWFNASIFENGLWPEFHVYDEKTGCEDVLEHFIITFYLFSSELHNSKV